MHAIALRYGTYRVEERHIMIRGGNGLSTVKIHLVLSGAPLMMAALRADVHLFQGQHDVAADILAAVHGRHVHIAAPVVGVQRGPSMVVQIQQIEFTVGADADFQTRFLRMACSRPKKRAAVHEKGIALRRNQVA